MPECDYCGASFKEEDAYLTHLGDDHGDELGRIDRRRVEQHQRDESTVDIPTGPAVLVGIILVAAAFVTYLTVFSDQNQAVGSTHIHGTITMTIDEEQVPAAQEGGSPAFHFHGNSRQWHVEATDVSLKQALSIVGVEISEGRVMYDGTTYREADPNTTITIEVNGQQVVPGEYTLTDGDSVRITINTGSDS
jgi:hypothetical protein